MLSAWDDFPVHQVAEPVRHLGTSDRNFYDRYYFNGFSLPGTAPEAMFVIGLGQYPNLGVQDAYALVVHDGRHRVLRASRELGDRSDLGVGPFRVEVLEPLRRVRVVAEPSEHPIAFDLTWTGAVPAFEEPRHFVRRHGRVLFDTARFAQTGSWSGTLILDGVEHHLEPTTWKGTRDRSWGVRPVGEPEPPGIRQGTGQMVGMWNYAPVQFEDNSILYIVQEEPDGTRTLEEAVRVWNDPALGSEPLGRPEYRHRLDPGTRMVREPSVLSFPDAPGGALELRVEPMRHAFIAVGTGYGMEDDWRHGMYQGPLVVQYREWPVAELETWAWFGVVDHVARFEASTGAVGWGLHEHGFFGPFPALGLHRHDDCAPG